MNDTFDRFTPKDRGRFGDNELASEKPSRQRVNGASDLVDVVLQFMHEKPLSIAVQKLDEPRGKWIWLPKSQIEFERVGTASVKVTLPQWLAKRAELV